MELQCKDMKNYCNNCNTNGHTEEKCWKIHKEMSPKNHKKDAKKTNLLATDSRKDLKDNLDVDENLICTIVQNEVNPSILHPKEEKQNMNDSI